MSIFSFSRYYLAEKTHTEYFEALNTFRAEVSHMVTETSSGAKK